MLAELAAGRLPLAAVKTGLPATRALVTDAARPPSIPERGPSTLAAPEALARFVIEIPRLLIDRLAMMHFEISYRQRDDILALLSALARVGRQPAISKTSEGETILSYSLPYRRDGRA